MNTISQHEAVVIATKKILGDRFQDGMDVKNIANREDKQSVINEVVGMFMEGSVSLSDEARSKYTDVKTLTSYTNGLVTNWWNKSKELNGGVKYEAKNPGIRAGSSDEQVKQMKILQKHLEAAGNSEAAEKVAEAIASRLEELKLESTSKKLPKVDISKIPEHLRDLVAEEI